MKIYVWVKLHPVFSSILFSLAWIGFIKLAFPDVIPLPVWGFWDMKGGPADWFKSGLPVLAWGCAVQLFFELLKMRRRSMAGPLENALLRRLAPSWFFPSFPRLMGLSLWISVRAGVMEEIAFRWALFLGLIPGIKIVNWILGACVFDSGLIQILHVHFFGWIADWATRHYVHDLLFHAAGWSVGAAVLASNAGFRDGHKYQGVFGWIDAWFFGMFMFWICFKHGLPAAILVHFAYDMAVLTIASVGLKLRE